MTDAERIAQLEAQVQQLTREKQALAVELEARDRPRAIEPKPSDQLASAVMVLRADLRDYRRLDADSATTPEQLRHANKQIHAAADVLGTVLRDHYPPFRQRSWEDYKIAYDLVEWESDPFGTPALRAKAGDLSIGPLVALWSCLRTSKHGGNIYGPKDQGDWALAFAVIMNPSTILGRQAAALIESYPRDAQGRHILDPHWDEATAAKGFVE